jgi:hypothetical protein
MTAKTNTRRFRPLHSIFSPLGFAATGALVDPLPLLASEGAAAQSSSCKRSAASRRPA